jgi:hypothetical protein
MAEGRAVASSFRLYPWQTHQYRRTRPQRPALLVYDTQPSLKTDLLGKLGVDDIRILVPVVDAHPHLLFRTVSVTWPNHQDTSRTDLSKRAEPRQNAPANPGRVLALGRRKDLYPHVLDRDTLHLGQQPVTEALGQGAAAREDDVGVQVFSQVKVGPVDRVDDNLVHAGILEADDLGVEEDFGRAEALCADL